MKKYKIMKFKNGLGKEFYCVKERKFLLFWSYLKFTKNINLNICGNLSKEAYMFDSIERAENLINRIKTEGNINININGEAIKKL